MQSVLLLRYLPILVSAGDFKLSLAFTETWKAEHLFLLLSHFISCACWFWHLGLLPLGKGGFRWCNGLFSVAVLYKKMGSWAYGPWGEVQFAFIFWVCVWGQLTWQSQSAWYCVPLWWKEFQLSGGGVHADEALIFVFTCLRGNMIHILRSFWLSLKMLIIDFSYNVYCVPNLDWGFKIWSNCDY